MSKSLSKKKLILKHLTLLMLQENSDKPSKIKERIENLNYVIAKFDEFAGKKDKRYKVFMQGICKLLDIHIAQI